MDDFYQGTIAGAAGFAAIWLAIKYTWRVIRDWWIDEERDS